MFLGLPDAAATITNQGDLASNASSGFTSDVLIDGNVTLAGIGTLTLQNASARIRDIGADAAC